MSREDIIVGTISASLSSLALGLFYLVLKSPQKPQQPRQNVDKNTLFRLLKQRKVQTVDKIGKLREDCKQQRLQYFLKDPAKYHLCINNLGEQVVSVMNTNVSELQNQNNLKLDDFNLALLINILQPDIKLLKSLKFYQTSVKESSLPSKQISQERAIEMLNVKCTTSRDLLNAVGQVNDQQSKTQIAYFFVWDELERRFPEYTYGQMEYSFVKYITDNPSKYRLFVEWMQNLDNMMTGKKQKVTKSLVLDIIFDTKKQINEDAKNLSQICNKKRKLYFKKNDEKYVEVINEFNQNITALINGKIYEVALSYGVEPQELDGVISQFLNDPETIRAMNELYSGSEWGKGTLSQDIDADKFEEIMIFKNNRQEELINSGKLKQGDQAWITVYMLDELEEQFNLNEQQFQLAATKFINENYSRFLPHIERENYLRMQLLNLGYE